MQATHNATMHVLQCTWELKCMETYGDLAKHTLAPYPLTVLHDPEIERAGGIWYKHTSRDSV